MNYASFWQRFAAVFIDGIIFGIINWLLSTFLTQALGNAGSLMGSGMSLIAMILYYVVYQAQAGQTLGKKALGIKVVDEQGKTPSVVTFFLREIIGKLVSGIILGIGYLMMLWDGRKQTLHDKIAGTFVIRAG